MSRIDVGKSILKAPTINQIIAQVCVMVFQKLIQQRK